MTFGATWSDDTPRDKALKIKKDLIELTEELGNIVGKAGGTYFNQANP